jgi:hypothetical protein
MNTKDLIKWALIAGAGYLLYTYLRDAGYLTGLGLAPSAGTTPVVQPQSASANLQIAAPSDSTSPDVAGPGVQASNLTPAAAPAVVVKQPSQPSGTEFKGRDVSAAVTADLVLKLASGDSNLVGGKMEFERWNYYYHQTEKGMTNPAPDPTTAGVDPNAKISIVEWWNLVHPLGISGLDRAAVWGWQRPNPWMA